MTKDEALNLIQQVFSQYKGTLQEHQLLQEAIKTINNLLISCEKKEENTIEDTSR